MAQARADLEEEYELEDEYEDEAFLGGLAKIAGSLLGEGEDEYEDELEDEDEYEDEAFFGGLAKIAGSLLGEGEDEYEAEDELEGEFEDEYEDELEGELEDEDEDEYEDEDEAFFGGLAKIAGSLLGGDGEGEYEMEDEAEAEAEAEEFFRKIGRAFRKAAPFLKVFAKTAGPLIATAVGGPAAGALARAATRSSRVRARTSTSSRPSWRTWRPRRSPDRRHSASTSSPGPPRRSRSRRLRPSPAPRRWSPSPRRTAATCSACSRSCSAARRSDPLLHRQPQHPPGRAPRARASSAAPAGPSSGAGDRACRSRRPTSAGHRPDR